MEEFVAWGRAKRVQVLLQSALELVGTHDPETSPDRT